MSKPIIVNKFGGGILTKKLIPFMKKRLVEQLKGGYQPIAVVSAMPKVTDEILTFLNKLKENNSEEIVKSFVLIIKDKHEEIIKNIIVKKDYQEKSKAELKHALSEFQKNLLTLKKITDKEEDYIVSYGEKLSTIVFTNYLNSFGLKAKRFLAEEIPIITDNKWGDANIDYKISKKNIESKLSCIKNIIVIPGFTGKTKDGDTTTLGRGGTDTTACFVGAALKANKIILWKDVGGIMSADPKIIKTAKTIPFINYSEALGAGKIIHDKAVQYVKTNKTSIEISSISKPQLKTIIGEMDRKEKGAKIVCVKKIPQEDTNSVSLVGLFDEKDVNDFNNLLIKHKAELLTSACYHKNCYRMEAVIRTEDISKIMKVVYKKFIK